MREDVYKMEVREAMHFNWNRMSMLGKLQNKNETQRAE